MAERYAIVCTANLDMGIATVGYRAQGRGRIVLGGDLRAPDGLSEAETLVYMHKAVERVAPGGQCLYAGRHHQAVERAFGAAAVVVTKQKRGYWPNRGQVATDFFTIGDELADAWMITCIQDFQRVAGAAMALGE